ncbi:UEV-domain-containing protein, partial [Sporormia fimetaria CBS 119925]
MSGVPEKVLNWLYSVLPGEYSDVNRTYHDVAESLSHYPSLSPRTEVYTYENGASALLLLLSGTLPVTFRGTTYGFPVAIWVPHAYPREPPMVYITPSQDMLVRPGQHVSGDGRVYHPYLAQWGKYWDKSTIYDFLAVLRGVFAKEPPVRSKQTPQSAPAQPAPPPVPPPPEEWRRSLPGPQAANPSPVPAGQAPVPPPKPPKPFESNGSPRPPSQQEGRYSRPAPLPPHSPQQPSSHVRGSSSSWQHQHPSPHVPPRPGAGYEMNSPSLASRPLRPQVQTLAQNFQPGGYDMGSPVSPLGPDDYRPSRYQKPAPMPFPQAAASATPPTSQVTVPPQQQYRPPQPGPAPPAPQPYTHFPQAPSNGPLPPYQYHQQPPHAQSAPGPPKPPTPINLIDEPLEVTLPSQSTNQLPLPVPPVPPNPEKDALLRALSTTLCNQIRTTVSSNTSALAPLRAQQTALQTAYSKLQYEVDQLKDLDSVLTTNERVLQDAMREADRVMEDARTRQVPDVDDVLVAPTVVGGQLYALCAEERALGDVLFVLSRGLDGGRVSAEVFVKQTRSLAREQFLKKALIKKIAKGLALDEYPM